MCKRAVYGTLLHVLIILSENIQVFRNRKIEFEVTFDLFLLFILEITERLLQPCTQAICSELRMEPDT